MKRTGLIATATVGLFALLGGASSAVAATSPNLGQTAPNAIVSSTFTNSNTAPQTTITGNVCYTTPPGTPPTTTNGSTVVPCPAQVVTDQGTALANLNGQACVSLGAGAVALNTISISGGAPGVFPPGCYSSGGAMNIVAGTTVTLNGAGTYIFRSGGAITTGATSSVVTAAGGCATDVFWTGVGATTLGASSTFVGTIIDDAGISIGHFATLTGRALAAGGTVTTDADTIATPTACASGVQVCVVSSTAPTITGIAAQTVPVGGSATVNFTIGGGVIPNALVLTSTSSNLALVPQSAIQFGPPGSGGARTLTVTGADGRSGVATITVTVTDPTTNCATTSVFLITIGPTAVPTMPQWAMIALAGLLGLGGVVALRRRTI